ncbi:MAG TPA: hypothetical protein VF432_23920 [Thermoanaerobaculia bacterium]
MLEVFRPGSRRRLFERRVARRPWPVPARGAVIRSGRTKLRITAIGARVDRSGDRIEHVIEIYTQAVVRRRERRIETASNVVRMPTGDTSMVGEFLRYHVLVRVFNGDPDAWLAHLRQGGGDGGDLRFVRWIRSRLRQDPSLLASIRKMVDATPFWRVAEA